MLAFVGTMITGKQFVYKDNLQVKDIMKVLIEDKAVGILGSFYFGGAHYVDITGIDGDEFLIADSMGDFTKGYNGSSGYEVKLPAHELNKYWNGPILYNKE